MRALHAIALLLAGAVAGCAAAPDPTLYILASETAPPTTLNSDRRIGLSEITLPAYARQLPIASLSATNRIVQDDDHRWAAPPSEVISAALSRALERELQSAVVIRPYPRGLEPDVQLRVTFDRFLRSADGGAELNGQFLLIEGRADAVSSIQRFSITVPARGSGYEAYMRAVASAVDELSVTIASALTAPK